MIDAVPRQRNIGAPIMQMGGQPYGLGIVRLPFADD